MTDIRVNSVSKHYGGRPAVNNVHLTVPDGAVMALLGSSGCGKTTLLRLIAGFERCNGGEIRLGRHIVDSDDGFVPPERRHVGYVPQEGALFPHLTAARNIGFGLRDRKGRSDRISEMLDLIGLTLHADKFPHELSGGQQQRVAIARALAPNPDVILLDEPFNALDLDLRRRISEEIVGLLRQAGTTTLLVTHDPEEAFAASDLVAVMKDGSIIQCAAPIDLYRSPASIDVARLTGETILLGGVMRKGVAETTLGAIPIDGKPTDENCMATVMLRPEQLRVGVNGTGHKAAVKASRFKGDHTVVTVDIGGLSLNVRSDKPPDGPMVLLRVAGAGKIFLD